MRQCTRHARLPTLTPAHTRVHTHEHTGTRVCATDTRASTDRRGGVIEGGLDEVRELLAAHLPPTSRVTHLTCHSRVTRRPGSTVKRLNGAPGQRSNANAARRIQGQTAQLIANVKPPRDRTASVPSVHRPPTCTHTHTPCFRLCR
eukprot:304268-Rhodomonas_salina.1